MFSSRMIVSARVAAIVFGVRRPLLRSRQHRQPFSPHQEFLARYSISIASAIILFARLSYVAIIMWPALMKPEDCIREAESTG